MHFVFTEERFIWATFSHVVILDGCSFARKISPTWSALQIPSSPALSLSCLSAPSRGTLAPRKTAHFDHCLGLNITYNLCGSLYPKLCTQALKLTCLHSNLVLHTFEFLRNDTFYPWYNIMLPTTITTSFCNKTSDSYRLISTFYFM